MQKLVDYKKKLIEFKRSCKILLKYLKEHNSGTKYEDGQIDLLKLQLKDLK